MPNFTVTDAATGRSGAIHYEHHNIQTAGRERPTVVLAHGWGMSTRIWDDTTAWLIDEGYPVLSFDERNCGVSDKDFVDVSIAGRSVVPSWLRPHQTSQPNCAA